MARPLSRRAVARYVAEQLAKGEKKDVVLQQLAAYLLQYRRSGDIDTIVRDIAYQLTEAGFVEAEVTVAHDLTKATEKAVAELVKNQTGAQNVVVTTTVDESVLGGVKIQTPGRELDATVAHQLHTLRTRYKKA